MRTFVAAVLLLSAMRAAAAEPAVRIAPTGDDPTRIEAVCRLSPAAAAALPAGPIDEAIGRRHLTFSLLDADTGAAGPPIFGSYAAADGQLTFRPAFGLVRGATYRAARLAAAGDGEPAYVDYHVPTAAPAEPTVVLHITPGGDRLPANVLRFYVTFSRPMREGSEVLKAVRLYDDAGKEIASPWRDIELWNADATRLSLFLHPGRIKQGVNLREELGPLLEPNRKYALVVGGELRDAAGAPLGRDVRRSFFTTAEVRSRVDVAAWRITPPRAGTREPLRVEFDRPLDAALALRMVQVRDEEGIRVAGEAKLFDHEKVWVFTPAGPWRSDRYAVHADPLLEDPAGNTPVRVFDRDLTQPEEPVTAEQLIRRFTPR